MSLQAACFRDGEVGSGSSFAGCVSMGGGRGPRAGGRRPLRLATYAASAGDIGSEVVSQSTRTWRPGQRSTCFRAV